MKFKDIKRAYVISVCHARPDDEMARFVTDRAMQSCRDYGIEPVEFPAVTPEIYPEGHWDVVNANWMKMMKDLYFWRCDNNPQEFMKFIRLKQCMSLSHYNARAEVTEPTLILEQDGYIKWKPKCQLPLDTKVVNFCHRHSTTVGYALAEAAAKEYNAHYDTKPFMAHDKVGVNWLGDLKVSPFLTNPVVWGNEPQASSTMQQCGMKYKWDKAETHDENGEVYAKFKELKGKGVQFNAHV